MDRVSTAQVRAREKVKIGQLLSKTAGRFTALLRNVLFLDHNYGHNIIKVVHYIANGFFGAHLCIIIIFNYCSNILYTLSGIFK